MGRGQGIAIAPQLYQQILEHCRSRYPKEACGLLAGAGGIVQQVYPMTNLEDSPIGYAMDPKEQLRVERQMRQQAQQLLGIYHSHTASAAYPSSVDVRLAISPDVSYVLISLQDQARPELKSYRIDGARVMPEDVQVLE
jgi:proteasome lid subunit RPN8/RPN11